MHTFGDDSSNNHKNPVMKKVFSIVLFVILFASIYSPVFADNEAKVREILPPQTVTSPGDAGAGARQTLPTGDFRKEIIPKAITILLAVMGSVSFLVFTYAGIMLIIAQGNEEQITKFKNVLIWSLVGLLLITLSYGIIRGVMQLSFTT